MRSTIVVTRPAVTSYEQGLASAIAQLLRASGPTAGKVVWPMTFVLRMWLQSPHQSGLACFTARPTYRLLMMSRLLRETGPTACRKPQHPPRL